MDTVRTSGPIAYRFEASLPEPLDDCSYLPGGACVPDVFDADLCGDAGTDLPAPWDFLPVPDGTEITYVPGQHAGDCTVSPLTNDGQVASIPALESCCGETCQTFRATSIKTFLTDPSSSQFNVCPIFALLSDGSVIYLTVAGASDLSTAGLLVSAAVFAPDFSPAAVATTTIDLSLEDYAAERIDVRMSVCPDGNVGVRATTGSSLTDLTLSGWDGFASVGATVERYGFSMPPTSSSISGPVAAFYLTCGALPGGSSTPFEGSTPPPVPVDCTFQMALGLNLDEVTPRIFSWGTNTSVDDAVCVDAPLEWTLSYLVMDPGAPRPTTIDWADPGWTALGGPPHTVAGFTSFFYPDGSSPMLLQLLLYVNSAPMGRVVLYIPETLSGADHTGVYAVGGATALAEPLAWFGPITITGSAVASTTVTFLT